MLAAWRAVGVVCVVATLWGCGASDDTEALENRSARDIFVSAEDLLNNGDTSAAGELFDEVERLYPYSQWAKRAMMMSAFSYYRAGRYTDSRLAAGRFLDFYPADPDAPYAQYLIALSYYDQISDVSRDQGNTVNALQELREVVERYPDSDFSKSADLKFDLALDHLAGKEMDVGRYYLKQGHYTAAINRFRVVVEDFETTTHTPEALHRLIECYLSLGLTDEAQTAGAILGHNYQGSEWYRDSYALLTAQGLTDEPRGDGWLRRIYRQVIQGRWL